MWLGFKTQEEAEIVYNGLIRHTVEAELDTVSDDDYRVCIYASGISFTDCGHGLLITLPTTDANGENITTYEDVPKMSVDLNFYNVHIVRFCCIRS